MNPFIKLSSRKKNVIAALAVSLLAIPSLYAADAPATEPEAPTDIIATVNGQPISREFFDNALTEIYGPATLQQLVPVMVLRDACIAAGVQVTADDFKAEAKRMLDGMKDQLKIKYPELPTKDYDAAINQILRQEGLTSPIQFQLAVQRNAMMHALAQGKITDADLAVRWKNDNAPRVEALDIIVPDQNAIMEMRKAVVTDKQDVIKYLQSKGYQAQQVTFSKTGDVQKLFEPLKNAVFASDQKMDDFTQGLPIEIPGASPADKSTVVLHVEYCQKAIPATGKAMSEEDKKKLTETMENEWAEQHLRVLMATAHIEVKDKALLALYQHAAATQPATQPATAPK